MGSSALGMRRVESALGFDRIVLVMVEAAVLAIDTLAEAVVRNVPMALSIEMSLCQAWRVASVAASRWSCGNDLWNRSNKQITSV